MNTLEENGFELQKCPDCTEYLPQESFYPSNWGKYGHKCKACAKKYYNSPKGKKIRYESQKKYNAKNRDKINAIARAWRKNNPEKYKETVYNCWKNNPENYVQMQVNYQSKIPPGVYCIKHKDEVVYVGSTQHPIRRINTHLSTITTSSNIGAVNKLHSFLGYNKKDFTWELVEETTVDKLIEREKYYRKKLNSKANYKKHFGKVETTRSIVERLGLTTKPRNKWK